MSAPGADPSGAPMLVAVYAYAALRRRKDALEAISSPTIETDLEVQTRALGEGTLAVLSLYLAACAAQEVCKALGEPGPLGRDRLNKLRRVTGYLRDAVMHWDEKGRRDPNMWVEASTRGVRISAPDGRRRGPSEESGISWTVIERDATRLLRWSAGKLGQDPDAPPDSPQHWPWEPHQRAT